MYLSDVSSRLYAQEDAEIAEGDRAASVIEQQRTSDWSKYMKEFRALAGREVQVHGDGLCWLYAVLTSMNVLENPSLLTERDRKVLKEFVQDLKRFVRDGGLQKKLTDKESSKSRSCGNHLQIGLIPTATEAGHFFSASLPRSSRLPSLRWRTGTLGPNAS